MLSSLTSGARALSIGWRRRSVHSSARSCTQVLIGKLLNHLAGAVHLIVGEGPGVHLVGGLGRLQILLRLLLLLILILLLLVELLLWMRRVWSIAKVARSRTRVRRQHAPTVVLCLSTVDGLREGRRCGRVDSSIGRVELVLLVELKVQAQPIVVVIHGRTDTRSLAGKIPHNESDRCR